MTVVVYIILHKTASETDPPVNGYLIGTTSNTVKQMRYHAKIFADLNNQDDFCLFVREKGGICAFKLKIIELLVTSDDCADIENIRNNREKYWNDHFLEKIHHKNEVQKIFDKCAKRVSIKSETNPYRSASIKRHDGKIGHRLERLMGVKPNSKIAPDILGFEMKKASSSGKITFGDLSASEYAFSKNQVIIKNEGRFNSRDEFIRMFGTEKKGRFSWSGKSAPSKIGKWSERGQRLMIDLNGNIIIEYSFDHDEFPIENMPQWLKNPNGVVIAVWTQHKLRNHVEQKFGNRGFFIVFDDKKVFTHIRFGPPFTFEKWIDYLKNGLIFLDSGMKERNPRPYSPWRALNNFWYSILE